MIRLKWVAMGVAVSAFACGDASAQATVFWTGTGGNGPGFSQASNWVGDVTPANDGSQVLGFFHSNAGMPSGNSMTLDVSVNVKGLDMESDTGSANISITPTGLNTLTIGSSGIWMNQTSNNAFGVADITAPIILSANQTWSIRNSNLTISGAVSEGSPGTSLTISNTGGTLINASLDSGASTFSGGLTLTGGPGTLLIVGASSTGPAGAPTSGPVGTGTLTVGNLTEVQGPPLVTITLGNNIVAGNTPGANTVIIEGGPGGNMILTGTISDPAGGTGLVQVVGGSADFEGNNTFTGGTNFAFATVTIGTDTGLGFGPMTANNSTLNFTSNLPNLFNPIFANATTANFSGSFPSLTGPSITTNSNVNFTQAGAEVLIDNLSMVNSAISFSAGSIVSIFNMTSDSAGSTNSINLNNTSVLSFNEIGTVKYYGTISGVASSVSYGSDGAGLIDLYGANTYSGGSTISTGALVVADNNTALGTGVINVNGGSLGVGAGVTLANQVSLFNGAIGGYGTIAPGSPDALDFPAGDLLAGGRGTMGSASGVPVPGTLTFGPNVSLTLAGGGTMQFSIMNATGVAGTDFSAINSGGSVNITATAGSQFNIQLVAVNPGTGQFLLNSANFNNSTAYSWTLLSAGSPITGFTGSNQFNVDDTTDFQNPFQGGMFSVGAIGNQLTLTFTPVPEPSAWILMATGLCTLGAAVRRRR